MSRVFRFSFVACSCALLGAGCLYQQEFAESALDTSRALVKLSGAYDREGSFTARCAPYRSDAGSGFVFDTRFDGWQLIILNEKASKADIRPAAKVRLEGPEGTFGLDAGATVIVGNDLKQASVKGGLTRLGNGARVTADVQFRCK